MQQPASLLNAAKKNYRKGKSLPNWNEVSKENRRKLNRQDRHDAKRTLRFEA